jgi:hypothetical protein
MLKCFLTNGFLPKNCVDYFSCSIIKNASTNHFYCSNYTQLIAMHAFIQVFH